MTAPAPPATPRLPIVNGYQYTLQLTQNGQPAAVVLGYFSADGTVPSQSAATALGGHIWTAVQGLCTGGITCIGGTLRSTNPAAPLVLEVAAPASPSGGNATNPAVAAAASLIKWQTANGTRSGKGRSFVPGLPAAFMDGDARSYSTTGVSAIQGAATALVNGAAAVPFLALCVLSFKNGAAYDVLSGAPGKVVGIQRKRMRA